MAACIVYKIVTSTTSWIDTKLEFYILDEKEADLRLYTFLRYVLNIVIMYIRILVSLRTKLVQG